MATTTLTERQPQDDPTRFSVIDTDAHNIRMPGALLEYLPTRWREYYDLVGTRTLGMMGIVRHQSGSARGDSWPPSGLLPGEDPEFMREQLLDTWGIDISILNQSAASVPQFTGGNQPIEYTAALLHAANEHTEEAWFASDPRWRGSICVPWEDGKLAAAEVDARRSGVHRDRWVQVLLSMGSEQPLGRRKYWDMWEAIAHHDIPAGFHPGDNGLNPPTGSGWPSFYFENHAGYPQQMLSELTSLIFEGVLDRWPNLKLVSIEGGYSWVAPFAWRMDKTWDLLKDEVSHLQRKPSEYIRDHLWFTSQPFEEPENSAWFAGIYEQLEGLGMADKLMYSSDYPHWDFDSPGASLPVGMPERARRKIMVDNAVALYGF
jgi:uncharacterized protein